MPNNKDEFNITGENQKKEKEVLEEIKSCVDKKVSILFDSGAGAGKTYTLIETLKYILSKHEIQLKKYNQKIVCITFTNIAALEVEERLGKSSLITVSTIHAWIWDIIKIYQKEIFEIHIEKIKEKIEEYEAGIATRFNDKEFMSLLYKHKQEFYSFRDLPARDFKKKFGGYVKKFENLLSNIETFKKNSNKILKKIALEESLLEMKKKEKKKITYNSKVNYDRLERMEFSHDTLLVYAYKLISKYKNLRKILVNKFPYILIDEYQDTSEYVVNFINLLDECSSEIDRKIFVGYYGDGKQNIYSNDTNTDIKELLVKNKSITKTFNRRSANSIIEVANKIRNDNLKQESIFNNMIDGEVNFFTEIDRELFLNFFKEKWGINTSNKLHCLELTNEGVSAGNGFIEIYDFFKNTNYYKTRFRQISIEILNFDTMKLGKVPLILFKILDFLEKIQNPKSMITDVIPKNYLENSKNNLTYKKLFTFVETLQKVSGNTLFECISNLFDTIKKLDYLRIEDIVDEPITNITDLKSYIFDKLYIKDDEDEYEECIGLSKIDNFLNLDIEIFRAWYSYIKAERNKDVVYHTYHGTKGLEFDNVIIFMKNSFNRNSDFFTGFFKNYTTLSNQHRSPQNLLYVAVTRAKKNLAILFLDELPKDDTVLNIEKIFGKINKALEV